MMPCTHAGRQELADVTAFSLGKDYPNSDCVDDGGGAADCGRRRRVALLMAYTLHVLRQRR